MDTGYDDVPLQTGEIIPSTADIADEHTFKILVATDIHLGYCDNNPARENDSFDTFEEILQIGVKNDVDFVLLGGDLFHENKPRPNVLRKATEILRRYCLGDRPVSFQYVGNPKRDFPTQDDHEINYYNANINIALPVFTIHGNHDDPIGTTKTSAVDHLAAAKLLNHFGQWDNLNNITVTPVLLTKGDSKLALYGLGHLKDERLYRLIHDKKVEFIGPEEDQKSWFNLFTIHQNRVKHGPKNYIPENFIPGYMDLVLWGHEHECRIKPELAEGLPKTYITQPGSSVATSLCGGEAVDKCVGILRINRRIFKMDPVKLETVRPFVMKDVMTKDIMQGLPKNTSAKDRVKHLEKYVENMVESLIEEAEDKLTGHEKQPTQPLIRVRIFHDDVEETFNPIRFSQKFNNRVVNDDIVMFKKIIGKREAGDGEIDADEIGNLIMQQDDDDLEGHVESIVETYFNKAREDGNTNSLLEVLSERGLSEAVKSAVEKEDFQAISVVIESQIEKLIEYLIKKQVTEETVDQDLEEFRERRTALADQERTEVNQMLGKRQHKLKPTKPSVGSLSENEDDASAVEMDNGNDSDVEAVEIEDDDDEVQPTTSSSRGKATRGRGRGRGARGSNASTASSSRGRSARGQQKSDSPPPSKSTRARGRGAKAKESSSNGRQMVQTTLNMRRSPRKGGSQAMTFDDSD